MVARLHHHAAESASDNSADDASDETAQEPVARVGGGLVDGGNRDEDRGGWREFTKCGATL
jgi:hypothetical protein